MTSTHTKLTDIERDWEVIKSTATMVIDACSMHKTNMAGDDQLEENEVAAADAGEELASPTLRGNKTLKMPLAGKIWCRKSVVHPACQAIPIQEQKVI